MNIKRFMAAACAATLALSAAACDRGGTKAGGKTEIKIWSNTAGRKAVMAELAEKYNKTTGKEKGIEIVYEVLTGNAGQQLDVALQAGTVPEIIPAVNLETNTKKGYFQAIDEIEGGNELLQKYFDSGISVTEYDGHYYSLPDETLTAGMAINVDMFKAAGLVDENGDPTPPKTYAELREYAKKLTNPSKREYGIIFPGKSSAWYEYMIQWPMMSVAGHNGFDPKTNQYDYSGLKPIFQSMLDLKEDGSVYPGTEAIDADPARARFAEGNVGMMYVMSWDVGVLRDQFPAKCDWEVYPLPVVDENDCYKQRMDVWSISGIAKFKEDSPKEKIFEVYKWMNSDEVNTALYQEGIKLPWNLDIVKDVDTSTLSKQWVSFADMMSISRMSPSAIKTDTTGATKLFDAFVSEVWNGGAQNIDKVLNTYTKAANDGMKIYKDQNPDYDETKVIEKNKDFDASR